jgi:NHLM bacteriocin system ABC transporter ATP-binding protein
MTLIDSPRPEDLARPDIVLGMGGVLVLDEIPGFISVETGRVEIYSMVGETRCFLAEFGQGAVLVCAGDGRFIALAPDGARLSSHEARSAALEAEIIDAWLHALSEGVARYAPARPDLRSVMVGETIALSDGEALSAGRGIGWLQCETAINLFFLGMVPVAGDFLPISPAVWIVARASCSVEARSTFEAVNSNRALVAIAAFHNAVADVLHVRIERDRNAEVERVDSRERLVRQTIVHANERLVGVLSARRPKTPDHADDVAFVLDKVTGARTAPDPEAIQSQDVREAIEARGLRGRTVSLTNDWWREDRGNLVGFLQSDQTPVALLPNWRGRYRLWRRGERPRKLDAATAQSLQPQALAVAQPLPNRPLDLKDLAVVGARLCRPEIATILVAGLGAALLGLLLPLAIGQVIDTFIPDRLRGGVLLLGAALAMLNLCSSLLQFGSDMARLRIDAKLSTALQVGLMDRVLRLPSRFLRSQTSADLTFRVMALDNVRRLFTNTVLSSLVGGLFGLTSFGLLFYYSLPAGLAALGIFALFMIVSVGFGKAQLHALTAGEALTVNLTGLTLQIIQNVSMLRAFGAERRAFALWAQNTATMRSRNLRARLAFIGFETFLACYDGLALAAVFLILGYASRGDHLSTGAYLAFVAAFQGFLVSSEGLGRAIVQVAGAQPMMRRAAVLLTETPETSDLAQSPGELRGELEVSSASFRYDEESPLVLANISIRAEPGKFIAIAGPSGCGKSTLMGLILGFNQPTSGAVLYDGRDLSTLNKAAVRRQIGVVRQGGRMIGGTIFENILGMHDGTIDDAWEAAEAAGIADDIRAMPMGLHTVLNEGVPTFSGGQVQRLLIARALVGKPKILLLDEATSALDNITQAGVSASIERLGVTRIVIAHRLSTIRNADTIHFFDHGRVAESGTYDALMRNNGLFAAFASRQTL